MKRDVVAPMRKAKIHTPAAPPRKRDFRFATTIYRVFRNFCRNPSNLSTQGQTITLESFIFAIQMGICLIFLDHLQKS